MHRTLLYLTSLLNILFVWFSYIVACSYGSFILVAVWYSVCECITVLFHRSAGDCHLEDLPHGHMGALLWTVLLWTFLFTSAGGYKHSHRFRFISLERMTRSGIAGSRGVCMFSLAMYESSSCATSLLVCFVAFISFHSGWRLNVFSNGLNLHFPQEVEYKLISYLDMLFCELSVQVVCSFF